MNVQNYLENEYSDRVFIVENETVWVSGMNSNCKDVAERMAKDLIGKDIPCTLTRDDGAAQNGGVEFDYEVEDTETQE